MQGASPPITSLTELVSYFEAGKKPPADWRMGVEHEKIGIHPDGTALAYEGPAGIRALLERFQRKCGYEPIVEAGNLIGLTFAGGSITLEPGGQFELSAAKVEDGHQVARQLAAHMRDLFEISAELGIDWLALGFRPFGTIDQVPWMPKGRYRVMRDYLPGKGRLAPEMMLRTATAQANVDYEDEADAARKMRTAMGTSSLLTALFANSSIVDGKVSTYQTYRAAAWLETDPDRCGLLPFAFEPECRLFSRYTEWALDVPMFFVYRDGYLPAGGMTFRRFFEQGFQGHRATLADWEVHLSTLFPEVRLKHYLELRGADAGPVEYVVALAALGRGLLYDRQACDAAWALVERWTLAEREALRREVPLRALDARVAGHTVRDWLKELLAIARAGAERLGRDEARLLDPLDRIVREGKTLAERARQAWHHAAGDPSAFIAAVRYR